MEQKNERRRKAKRQPSDFRTTAETPPIASDVLGSYTGITEDGEPPVQDADDL